MSNTNLMALPSPLTNITQYAQLVETFPRLDEDEERTLAESLRRDDDIEAAYKLITSNLRYVVHIARRYTGYGLPQEDLIQEGNLGLMKAVRRFDPKRGVRLIAYAAYWIRAHIHDYILKNWRLVKITTTKAKRKLFYKLRGAKQRLQWLNRTEAENIAEILGVTASDVVDMEAQLYLPERSFDGVCTLSQDNTKVPADYLADCGSTPEDWVTEGEFLDQASSSLPEALSALDSRSRDIIENRWLAEEGDKLTLHALGERYGVSAERIRQIEVAAIARLREMLISRVGEHRCGVELPRQRSLIAV